MDENVTVVTDLPGVKTRRFTLKRVLIVATVAATAVAAAAIARSEMFVSDDHENDTTETVTL